MPYHLKTTALAAVMGLGALATIPAMADANSLTMRLASRGNSGTVRIMQRSPRHVRPTTRHSMVRILPGVPPAPSRFAAPSRTAHEGRVCIVDGVDLCVTPWISPWNTCVLDYTAATC